MIHTLLLLLVVLAIVGVILWGISQIPGIPPPVKIVVYVVVAVILLLWVYEQLAGASLRGL